MTKISFKTLLADSALPLSLADFLAKDAYIDELLRSGEITLGRARGLYDQLVSVGGADVAAHLADEAARERAARRDEMIADMIRIAACVADI